MKNLLLIFTLMFLISCQKELTKPDTDLAALSTTNSSVSISNGTAPGIYHFLIPIDFFIAAPCTGQMTHWIGTYKADVNIVYVGSRVKVSSNDLTLLKGVDETGNTYIAIAHSETSYVFDFTHGQYNHINYISREIVTSSANGLLLKFYFTERYTITPNGEVKAELTDFSITCQ